MLPKGLTDFAVALYIEAVFPELPRQDSIFWLIEFRQSSSDDTSLLCTQTNQSTMRRMTAMTIMIVTITFINVV